MKRADIQGLRTLAILAVLFYHIWPLVFPSGFLGVDVYVLESKFIQFVDSFFVISGLLIAKCLANIGTDLRWVKVRDKVLHFYARRIHRIVPVYLALVCGTASIARALMLDSDFQKARTDMFWALGFVTNLEGMFQSEDYFAEVFAYRPFLHCWSLGVEMQFYLMAPALMLLMALVNHRFWRFGLCGSLLLASVGVQQLLTHWDNGLGFGLVFCRLWQFFAGMLVFFLIDMEKRAEQQSSGASIWPFVLAHQPAAEHCTPPSPTGPFSQLEPASVSPSSASKSSVQKEQCFKWRRFALQQFLSHALLLTLVAILLQPWALPPLIQPIQSTAVVLLTAGLIFLHKNAADWPAPVALTNAAIVQLGDLSYVWYLVHWPTIVFVKYFFTIDSFKFSTGAATLLLTVVLAFLVDRLLDSHIRKLPNFCAVLFVIGLFYTFCFFLILPTYYSGQIERIATVKDYDGSFGERAVTVDANFTKLVIDEMQSSESRARLASTLSQYEKIRMNELIQSATFDDRYKLLPGEQHQEKWSRRLAAMIPEQRNFLKAVNERRMPGTGNGSWLLVGNSHADVISRELQAEYHEHFSLFQMFTVPGCVPFYVPERLAFVTPDHALPTKACVSYAQLMRQAVESIKPDVLFIAFRWYGTFQEMPFENERDDELLGLIRSFLAGIQPNVGQRIFFPAPNLLFKYDTAKELAKRLWQGADQAALEELHLSYKEHMELNHWSYQRLTLLPVECPKCTVYDFATQFCSAESGKCLAFDEQTQLALFFDNNHISYLGRQRVRPFLGQLMPK